MTPRIFAPAAALLCLASGAAYASKDYTAEAVAAAQNNKAAIRLGFAMSNDFLIGANKSHLEGFQVGADLPFGQQLRQYGTLTFSPTLTFGGGTRKGADTDGYVYRLMVNLKHPLGDQGLYVGAGIGYSGTQARNHEFSNVSGFADQLLVGYNLPSSGRYATFLEFNLFDGVDNKVRGWSADLGVRF